MRKRYRIKPLDTRSRQGDRLIQAGRRVSAAPLAAGKNPLQNEIVNLTELGRRLGHRFKRKELLFQALCHASYINEQAASELADNERLEFLGDAVLDLAISDLLMQRFQEATEGDLSKYRAMIVDESGLCEIAQRLGLGDYILLGKGEAQSDGRAKPSILANTVEAIVGAVFLDAGFEKARKVIDTLFAPLIDKVQSRDRVHDYKSLLQEYTQKAFRALPQYRLIEETGPPHDKTFKIALWLSGTMLAEGCGKSKKEAEQQAAREAFRCLDPA
ncbi:RNase III [uncultured Desulfatiglans sp.]|nr:RNase III [uncultured Desulfatiglans sp.]